MKTFDAIIIGSGQAGTPLAFELAGSGLKVALIEKKHLGGTCINTGCTPTKAYVASARRIWIAQNSEELGIITPQRPTIDLLKVKSRKDQLIRDSQQSIRMGIENEKNIYLFEGEAKFVAENAVEVNSEKLQAAEIFINTGASPNIPEIFNDPDILTNESILQLDKLPEHLVILGGSYIGLEFGQMFRRFGSKVTIIEKGSALIGREDIEVSKEIHKIMEEGGINIFLNATSEKPIKNPDRSFTLEIKGQSGENKEISASHILLAMGRKPNTSFLNLSAAGIKTNDKGYIQVNDYLQTNRENIYALGDCNGKGAFTHTSYNDYEIIAANRKKAKSRKVSDRIPTWCLYIDPPLSRAGLNIKEALEKEYHILKAHIPMSKVARAKEKGETDGFMTIVIDKKTGKILGASILGTGSDEIISSILNIMYAKVPYTVIRDSVIPHPTVAELIPSMLEDLHEPD
jgi:pyruvate/2-oxoglutarate dehydrogenase complex dihydrolipoamide dehydrogenase (E3) component